MTKRKVEIEDILRVKTISDPQVSFDGARAVFVLKSCSVEENAYDQQLWMLDVKTHECRQITFARAKHSCPRWSPDGRWIAFVRTADDVSQVCVLPTSGGEARTLTKFEPGSVGGLDWSPDSLRLVFTYRKAPRFPENKKDPKVPVARHITRLFYKLEGMGFVDNEYSHVWTVDLDGVAKQLTQGDCDETGPRWSPDGKWIAFTSNRNPDRDYRMLEVDIWVMPAGGGEMRALKKPKGPAELPAWSPDGRYIAYLGHPYPEESWGARNTHVWVASLDGEARDLVPNLDRPCEDLTLTDTKPAHGDPQAPYWDGDWVYFLVSDRGTTNVYRVSLKGGAPEPVTQGRHEVINFSLRGGRMVMSISSPHSACELHYGEGQTRFNEELMGEVDLAMPEEFECAAPDGAKVHGWILKPPGFDPKKKYPMALEIHGGPRTQYGWAFFHEFQLLASRGYVVVYTNPRGSHGYGEAHTRAILEDWGNLDYQDLMAAVDHVVKLGFVDEKRMGVLGGSYGGYMTNWIVGHTDRFRAAVTMRSVTNLVSFAGTSDIGFEDEKEFGAVPWTNLEKLWRQSPIAYVANIKTPLLILHSEGDLRCPVEQAEQLYTFLKMQKKEVEFVRIPEENHDLSRAGRPDRRVERLKHIVRWFDKHLR